MSDSGRSGAEAPSGHSPKGGAASSTASPAKPSVPNAEPKEAMSPFLAVFNHHVNNADERARKHLARGPLGRRWLQEIERLETEGKGIMYIFDIRHYRGRGPRWRPPVAVRRYVSLVTKFVNENRVPRRAEAAEEETTR